MDVAIFHVKWEKNLNNIFLKLSPELQSIYDANVNDAIAWFNQVEGLPYGYHNFIFGFENRKNENIYLIFFL